MCAVAGEIVENRPGGGVMVWRRVVTLADRRAMAKRGVCDACDMDANECECPRPSRPESYHYKTIDGVLYATPKENEK